MYIFLLNSTTVLLGGACVCKNVTECVEVVHTKCLLLLLTLLPIFSLHIPSNLLCSNMLQQTHTVLTDQTSLELSRLQEPPEFFGGKSVKDTNTW